MNDLSDSEKTVWEDLSDWRFCAEFNKVVKFADLITLVKILKIRIWFA
jgi:hypothetical protein